MKPIPKRLLIHNAVLRKKTDEDAWGKKSTNDIKLNYIRIDPSSKLVQDKQNKQLQLVAILFYDCKNSIPRAFNFEEGQRIIFNNVEFVITTIEYLYDERKLHHIELGLV